MQRVLVELARLAIMHPSGVPDGDGGAAFEAAHACAREWTIDTSGPSEAAASDLLGPRVGRKEVRLKFGNLESDSADHLPIRDFKEYFY